ncbi:WD repeat-containing protein 60 [Platysternon megacephalum]|uniref:WD repeat-containing protein 60 n=1 Tax=Platysternon megacephalum TaxID=55544 RepID=A0A4D9EK78_9SAUR|nr:WD repeat-containing protein 60 [Platysternon megacephalum]
MRVVEDIEELDIEKDKRMEITSTDSHDDSIGVLNLSGEEEEASPGAGQPRGVRNDDSLERLVKLMRDLLKAALVDAVRTSGEQIRIVAAEQNTSSDSPASCRGSEEGVPEAKGAEPATRLPSVTSTKEALLATEDEPQASLGKTLEPRIGDQRGYNVIRCLTGGKTHSRGEDDTEGGYERDQQGATASPGADKKILPENDFNQLREDGDLLLQEGWGSLWVRAEEVPPSSGRASRSFPPGGITISRLTGSPSLDFPGAPQFNTSSETSHKTRTEPGPSWWPRPNPACQLCNDDTIHRLGGFRGFGPPDLKGLEEELRQKLSSCHKWGADAHGTVFSKAKRLFSNYCLCPSGDSRAQALARKAVLREIAVAAIQKKMLVGTMPSAHRRGAPTLRATTSQHKHGDFSPLFLQWALRKLKMLVKKTAPKS